MIAEKAQHTSLEKVRVLQKKENETTWNSNNKRSGYSGSGQNSYRINTKQTLKIAHMVLDRKEVNMMQLEQFVDIW